jgi:hypothetical protein
LGIVVGLISFDVWLRRMRFRSASTQVRCDHRPEVVYPAPNGLVGHRNAAFCKEIFDVAQAQGEPEVEPDRLLNDLGWEPVCPQASVVVRRAPP